MALRERLIQLTLRARDYLSRDVQPASDSVKELTEESKRLKAALNDAGTARSLARTLRDNEQATEGLERSWKDAKATLDDLTREYGENERATAGQRIAMREAKQAADAAERAYKRNQSAIKNTTSELNKLGVDTKNIVAEEQRLTAELDDGKQALDANRDAIKQKRTEERRAADATRDHASALDAVKTGATNAAIQFGKWLIGIYLVDKALQGLGAGIGLVKDGIFSMLKTGDQFELLDKRMASLMGSIAGGEQATAWIRDFAKNTPLEVADVTNAFALLKTYGLDPMDGALQAVVDKNEQLGGGMERLTGIASALGQAYGKQKLQTEEILQLVERGVPAWELLEKVTGKNAAQLSKLATEGRLGRDVIKALIDEMGKSATGAAAENMSTLTGRVSNLRDVWSGFLDRISKSGALDFVKKKLGEVADKIDQMDKDGRLDALAKSLSNAFIQGAERAEEFARKLAEIDFTTLTDDATRWLDKFGEKLDTTGRWVTMLTAPVRALFNIVTGGIAAIGVASGALFGASFTALAQLARLIPQAFGGDVVVAGLERARDAALGLMRTMASQVAQDGRDIMATLDSVAAAAEGSASRQGDAAAFAAEEIKGAADSAAGSAKKVASQFEVMLEATLAGERGIASLGNALQLIDTASTVQQLQGMRTALLKAYQDGKVSLEQYQQATALLGDKLKALGSAAGGAADLVSDLDEALGDLAQVQAAISNAKTDVDINNIRAALKRLYSDGDIDAKQYNEELKKTSDRQKELKGEIEKTGKAGKAAAEQLTDSQIAYNVALEDGIVTNEELRRISGKRMEEERRASGEAMERNRKSGEDTKRDMSAFSDFFGGVINRAREPLAALSAAALAAYDKLRGVTTVDLSMDTSGLEATTRSLEKAREELEKLQAQANTVGISSLGRWMTQSQVQSQQVQVQYLAQKASLQRLMEGYEDGSITLEQFVRRAGGASGSLNLLNDSDLSSLDGALESAKQRMEQLGDSTRGTLQGLQMELLQLQGTQEEIERARFASRRDELRAQQAQAQQAGDSGAASNLRKALQTLDEIETATANKRLQDAQQKRSEEAAKAAPAQAQQPTKVIRLESARGQAVNVALQNDRDETNLLSILADSGLRSL